MITALTTLLLVITPFVASPAGLDKFRLPKETVFWIGALFISGFFLAYYSFKAPWRWRSWETLLLFSVSYVLVHTLVLGRITLSLPATLWVMLGSVLLLAVAWTVPLSSQATLWWALAAACAVNGLLTVLEYFGYFPLLIRSTGEELAGRLTPAGLIGDVNSGGTLFGLSALMLLAPLATTRKPSVRTAAAALLVLNLVGLGISQTLTAMLAFVVAFLAWVVFHIFWLTRTRQNMRKVTNAAIAIVLIGALAGAGIMIGTEAGGRIAAVWSQMRAGDFSEVTSGRYPVYLITWRMIKEAPLRGRGLDTFGVDFFHYRADTSAASIPLLDQPGSFRETHNEYLHVWEELGLPGLVLFVLLLATPAIVALRKTWKHSDPKVLYWAGMLTLGVLFVAVNSLGFFPFRLASTALAILLLIAGLRRIEFETRGHSPQVVSRSPGVGTVIVVLFLAAVLSYPAIQRWRANSHAGVAAVVLEQAASSSLSPRQRSLYAETALTRLRSAESLCPYLYEIFNLQGSAYMMLGNYQESAKQYRRAAAHLPGPEVFTNLAAALMAGGATEEARRLLEKALRYNPSYGNAARALDYLKTRNP